MFYVTYLLLVVSVRALGESEPSSSYVIITRAAVPITSCRHDCAAAAAAAAAVASIDAKDLHCRSVTTTSCAKTDKPNEMPFGVWIWEGPGTICLLDPPPLALMPSPKTYVCRSQPSVTTKTAEPVQGAFWIVDSGGPMEPYYKLGGADLARGRSSFGCVWSSPLLLLLWSPLYIDVKDALLTSVSLISRPK